MNDPSVVPGPVPGIELPSMLQGAKSFKGSAGLVITWKLEKEEDGLPSLVCTLFTRTRQDEPSYVPPASGARTIRLSPRNACQTFQIERQALPGEILPPSDGVDPLQAHGVVYLGGLMASPMPTISAGSPNASLYLHMHCQLGASSGLRAKIAQGTCGLFIKPNDAQESLAEKPAKPLPAASANKPANLVKASATKKRSR